MDKKPVKITDSWESLKQFTAARIALGRAGNSIPLSESLDFKLAHAHARDAVYSELDHETLIQGLQLLDIPSVSIHSRAENRQQYLQRPDLGRLPDDTAIALFKDYTASYDICIILGDGLSANAINQNAIPLLNELVPLLKSSKYSISPICLASQARVALSDHIASGMKSTLAIMLIGERPGLSSADSIGAYLTYHPQPGLTDEARNCISNIRADGLPFDRAAKKIFYLVLEAFKRKLSGVELKDNDGLLNA